MLADVDLTRPLPGLSPVCGKPVIAHFDAGGCRRMAAFRFTERVIKIKVSWPTGLADQKAFPGLAG